MLVTMLWCAVSLPHLTQERPETLIRLTVDPMLAPQPALRYLLLPELRELTPGNPIANYLKCLLDQDFTRPDSTLGRNALSRPIAPPGWTSPTGKSFPTRPSCRR